MRKSLFVPALAVIVLAFLVAGASAQETKAEPAKAAPAKVAPSKIPPGKVAVEEETLVGFVDEPNHHFDIARESFMKKDYKASAADIRKSAGFVKLEAERATVEGRKVLEDAVLQLSKLAEGVEKGTVTSVDKLNETFAHTEQALAYHHELKAEEYWKEENHKKAGEDLKAASTHLENAMKHTGEKVETGTDTAIKDARSIGQKLVEGTGAAADKVGQAMQTLGRKIKEAGKKMGQPKK